MATTTGGDEHVATAEGERIGLVQRIIGWLRAGYPDGVPQQDYVALLGILRRSLTVEELEAVVKALTEEVSDHRQLLTSELVAQRIQDVVKGPIDNDDVVRVSARLAAAGWPLASPRADQPQGEDSDRSRPCRTGQRGSSTGSAAGYPAGLPEQDYVPLVALLRRRLTAEELRSVSRLLSDSGVIAADRVDIGDAIAEVTSELPSEEDIERVRRYLDEHGGSDDLSR